MVLKSSDGDGGWVAAALEEVPLAIGGGRVGGTDLTTLPRMRCVTTAARTRSKRQWLQLRS